MTKRILNKLLKLTSVFTLLLFVFAFQGDAPCDAKALKDKAKKQLEPYTYDMSKLTHITYKAQPWLKEIELPLFIGEKYRLVFNTEALSKQIVISIYNRDKDSQKRKLLFTTKDAAADKREFSFDLSMARKAFIDYEMPAGDSTLDGGCLVFMMGFK